MEKKIKYQWLDKTNVSKNAFVIVNKLKKAGFVAYIAGGAVRDALLKRSISEIDIATSATPSEVKKLFSKTIPTGEKHGTLTVRLSKINYEVTTFRTDGKYADSRRPKAVKFIKSAEEDAKRRDFTINALFFDSQNSEIIDYVEGLRDIKRKKIRVVGSEDRITEDALRMLRAVRFATTLKFDLAHETLRAIKKHAKLITEISSERIKQELDKIMLSSRASIGLGIADVAGILKYILPELKDTQGVTQPKNQHAEGDVYAHSLLALEETDRSYDLATRYAVLFHDLGKKSTRKVLGKKIIFYGHPEAGEAEAQKICRRLKFSNAETHKILWLIKYHMVPNDFLNMKLSTRRKWGLHEYFPDLLKVFLADARASLHPGGISDRLPVMYKQGIKILHEIKTKPSLRQPLLSGKDVMNKLKISEGHMVGKALKFIEEKKLSGEITTKKLAMEFLKKNKNLFK